MSQRFEQQMSPGSEAIRDVELPSSRDELPPVLKALQYIFITPELNEKAFALVEKKIMSGKQKLQLELIDLWQILVLAVTRRTVEANWGRLEHMANYDLLVRKIMGVPEVGYYSGLQKMEFDYQTIIDHVSLVDDTLVEEVNQLLAGTGYRLLRKTKRRSL